MGVLMLSPVVEPGVSSAIEALRNATRSRHAKLAASPPMVRLFDPGYTIAEYRAHLSRLLGLFEPLERAVAQVADPEDPVHSLQRSSDIREDLRMMGATARDIAASERCRRLPDIAPAGLRGYSYVILGSMLGGKIIVKRLRAILGTDVSLRFYGGGNGRSEGLWESFCSDLEQNGMHNIEPICETAVEIFDAYAAWLSEADPQ